jgi:hypothetical protein
MARGASAGSAVWSVSRRQVGQSIYFATSTIVFKAFRKNIAFAPDIWFKRRKSRYASMRSGRIVSAIAAKAAAAKMMPAELIDSCFVKD